MAAEEETCETIQGRLNVLAKSLVSERNSVLYYDTLIQKTDDSDSVGKGTRRMYAELRDEEKKHVQTIQSMIEYWEQRLKELNA